MENEKINETHNGGERGSDVARGWTGQSEISHS